MIHRREITSGRHSFPIVVQICQLFVLLLLVATGAGCSGGSDQSPTKGASEPDGGKLPGLTIREVTLALNWYPEAEHGGYYAALVHGYFEEAGLKVTIRPGGPGVPVIQDVATKRVEFGISNADQILVGRAREADVVAVFAALHTSPRCIMVHEASGIKQFDELKDLTLAINQNSTFGNFLQRKISLEGCTIVPYPGNVSTFLLTPDFAQQAYVFSEPFTAKKEGGDPRSLMAAEIGFNPYTSTLIAEASTIIDDPELVAGFVQAVQKGWAKYLSDPETTNRFILAQTDQMSEEDVDILEFGAKELQALCLPDDSPGSVPLGNMTQARWQTMADQLVECEVIDAGSLDVAKAFTTQFLKRSSPVTGQSEASKPDGE
ncbi:MAG: ABC transporter substrate-binding protein [Rhodopirellula sp.]|nr:ABC transporter substrate-binding protein [Rhodopirellula sp.]